MESRGRAAASGRAIMPLDQSMWGVRCGMHTKFGREEKGSEEVR
jgi:hypothetical protein